MMWAVYGIGSRIARLLIGLIARLGHEKAHQAVFGRHGWESRLIKAKEDALQRGKTGTWIHVHCASLGEHEQAAPVIAELQRAQPGRPILLTFFSPSGMEGVSDASVDHVDYLPFDTPGEAHRFARLLQPGDTLLVKYELWPHHLRALRQGGTHVHLMAARFDAGRHPLNRWGGWMRRQLAQLDAIQVQDAESQAVLAQWGLESEITGDPRTDRVLQSLSDAIPPQVSAELDRIAAWRGDRRMLIVGSAWEAEWQALTRLDLSTISDWAMLVVPHDVRGPHVDRWCADPHVIRSSQVEEGPYPEGACLVLDRIGTLRHAYGLAHLAVVGGGWGSGVHNTLEPAAHGLAIAVGPRVEGFREIEGLQQAGALSILATPKSLSDWLTVHLNGDGDRRLHEAGQNALNWVSAHRGAASRIVAAWQRHLG